MSETLNQYDCVLTKRKTSGMDEYIEKSMRGHSRNIDGLGLKFNPTLDPNAVVLR